SRQRATRSRIAHGLVLFFFFSSRRRHTRSKRDWSSDVCSSDLESGGNWHINTGNGFYGGLQFYHPTWKAFGGQAYGGYAHQASKEAQIAIGRRVLYAQGPGAWPVCSVKAGLTRANGGADPNAKPGDGAAEPAPDPGPGTRYVSARNAAHL